jgi:hypothetical protein
LADFEKSPIGSVLTEQQLAEDIRTQSIEGFLLFADDAEVMGMTLFHTAYSTWQGKVSRHKRVQDEIART